MRVNMILETMLRSAFDKKDLALLRRDLRFATALEHMYTARDFERVCRIGRRVLAARARSRGYAPQRAGVARTPRYT